MTNLHPQKKTAIQVVCIQLVFLLGMLSVPVQAQVVPVGSGSYSTTLPNGEVGPQNFEGQNVLPKVSGSFSLPMQTNDFWSSLIYPFYGDAHSNVMYADPLNLKATGSGLQIGHTSEPTFAANDFLYPFSAQITVGVAGLAASQTLAHDYGDWTVTAKWNNGSQSMEATFGHGLPYVYFSMAGGDATVTASSSATVWYNQGEVLGITVSGKHYGLFAPAGSEWTRTSTFRSSLAGKDYLSVALLPDKDPTTLELFRSHAYAFVKGSNVSWQYDEAGAELRTTYRYQTVLMENVGTNVDETLTALYRHQWLNTSATPTGYSYQSPKGAMKLLVGSSFSTQLPFSGVLPSLPDRGDYNKTELLAKVRSVASETIPVGGTYDNGKAMARFSSLVHIADQIGATEERDYFLSEIKRRLEDWFTAGGPQGYTYIDQWDVLTGYPSGFGADNQVNDHHFHSSYAIRSAATIAQYDANWASQEQWGGMVNMIIKDSNNWDRSDAQFPFLRSHDAYAGHSWAAGHGDFGDGNNQESSSESMNFASAVILWGETTAQQEIRDLGVFLYTTEASAVDQYWFDVDNAVFPAQYPHVAIGMVWGGKGVHSTWFGADPEFIHGINILPITSGSLYLGRNPDYVLANYNEIVAERSGQPVVWQDILWEYLALSDPNLALSYYYADINYEPFDGESRAHTLHWLYNLKKMGRPALDITANTATYSVFRNSAGELTYVGYNASSVERLISFSDGYSMTVGPNETHSESTFSENLNAPVALLLADKTSGKAPLTIDLKGSTSFDRNGSPLRFSWDIGSQATSSRADTVYTFTTPGEYWVKLTVTNGLNLVSTDSTLIKVLGNGSPFLGSPHRIPGRIEAEHFDFGGEGRAYHDADANNIGLAFRPNEGVDLEGANDGGFDVYWITAGEWLEYTFEVTEAGNFDISPFVATVPGFGHFRLLVDNVDVSGIKPVTNTGGWQFWKPILIPSVPIEAGLHVMRFEFDSQTDKTGWLFSLNYIQVSRSTSVGKEELDELPDAYKLDQNYPNPFNPSSEILFSLPKADQVKIEVFNSLGQHVAMLVNGPMEAEHHRIVFDGHNLPTGIYYYRMTTATFSQTRNMLLIK